jgi:ABC-2 type transport system permease protein
MFFTPLRIHNLAIVISVVLLTSMLFSLAGFINAIFAKKFDDISIIPTFILTPLIYLGGVFYSINLLPEFWQSVSRLNPILYMVNTFRYGLLGTSDISLTNAFTIIVGFIILLFGLSLYLLASGKGTRT